MLVGDGVEDGMCTVSDELRDLVLEVGVFVLGARGAGGEVMTARKERGIIESISAAGS
jgi:hypothetical protein